MRYTYAVKSILRYGGAVSGTAQAHSGGGGFDFAHALLLSC